MKINIKSVVLLMFVQPLLSFGIKAQNTGFDEVVRQDSLLYCQSQLNVQVLPAFPMEIGVACDKFLKRKERVERSMKGTSQHSFLDETWSDLKEFRSGLMSVDDGYEVIMQDKWIPYKKKIRAVFKEKCDSMCNESVEKERLISRIEKFGKLSAYKPLFYKTIRRDFHNDVRAYVNNLYETSMMCNKKALRKFLRNPSRDKLNVDAGAQFAIALKMYEFWLANHERVRPVEMPFFVCE